MRGLWGGEQSLFLSSLLLRVGRGLLVSLHVPLLHLQWIPEGLGVSPEGRGRVTMGDLCPVDDIGVAGLTAALLSLLSSCPGSYTETPWQRRWKDLRPPRREASSGHVPRGLCAPQPGPGSPLHTRPCSHHLPGPVHFPPSSLQPPHWFPLRRRQR